MAKITRTQNSYSKKVKELLSFFYQFKQGNLPHYLNNMPLLPSRDTNDHATRTQINIHQTKTNHEYAKKNDFDITYLKL